MSRSQQVGETLYEVVLESRCEAKIGENTAFLVELSYAGLFTIQGPFRRAYRSVPLIEGPRLLFPFARAIIADATRDGGYPPLMINPIDFTDLYRRQAAGQQAEQCYGLKPEASLGAKKLPLLGSRGGFLYYSGPKQIARLVARSD